MWEGGIHIYSTLGIPNNFPKNWEDLERMKLDIENFLLKLPKYPYIYIYIYIYIL